MADGSRTFTPPRSSDLQRVAAMYREHFRFVARVLRRCGIAEHNLDDAAQETFLVAFRRLDSFDGRASERTWLYAIAVRVASTLRRSGRREEARRQTAGQDMHGKWVPDPEAELTRAEAGELLDTLLDGLDQNKRTVFVLSELEGVKAAEISQVLGLNLRTVYSRLRLARESFDSAVKRLHAQERGRLHRAALRPRALAHRAEPDHAPRRMAVAALVARIERGDLPSTTGWEQIALTPAPALSLLAPLAATLALGGTTLAVIVAVARPTPDAPAPPSVAVAPAPSHGERPAAAVETAPTAIPTPEPTVSAPAPDPTPAPAARSLRATPKPAAPTPDPSIDAELALIERARGALQAGDPHAVLAALDAHAAAFPRGQLVTERQHTRIMALCAAGQVDQARALATRLAGGATEAVPMQIFTRACASP